MHTHYDPVLRREPQRFHDPSVSTEDAIGRWFKSLIRWGELLYASCSGDDFRQITMAMDILMRCARRRHIQVDEFVSQCVARVMKYYTFHNIICLNDPDTLVCAQVQPAR